VQKRIVCWSVGLLFACGGDGRSTSREPPGHAGAETHGSGTLADLSPPQKTASEPDVQPEVSHGMSMHEGMGMGMHGGAVGMHHHMGMSGMQASPGADLSSSQFLASSVCAGCHDGIRDASGNDVSLRRDWASTMMANATRDPFWRAKVRSELTRSPGLATEIAEECTRCHAPMAHTEAHAANLPIRVFDGGFLDATNPNHAAALEAVSCTLCHRIADDASLGKPESFSGGYVLTRDPVLFGPYRDVFSMPMQHMIGLTPSYGAQTQRSELCATCHNLKTPVTDAEGRVVRSGPLDGFPEQMPYTEWLASDFSQKQTCQDCHMGRTDGVVMATRPPRLSNVRDGFALHGFVGGNRLMLGILQDHRTTLGVGTDVDFTGILQKTDRLLASAAQIELVSVQVQDSVLEARVRVRNLSGHKLPTSFPSRRVFVQFLVSDGSDRVLFESGHVRADGSIAGDDAELERGVRFEPHYERIEDASQVQIYESVMGDLDGKVTYTLLRGARYLKDNRVLPSGADKARLSADIAVAGEAREDTNFLGGSDELTYRVAGIPSGSRVHVRAVLHYQPLATPFAADLFADGPTEAQQFQQMFQAAPAKTFTLAEASTDLAL
jgi:hypothetical protein